MIKYAIISKEEKRAIAKAAIKRLTKLGNDYRRSSLLLSTDYGRSSFLNTAKNYEAEAWEYIKDFPELG